MTLALLLVLFLVVLFLIMVGSAWFVNVIARHYIGNKHRDLEAILNSGQIPKQWTEAFDKKIKALENKGGRDNDISRVRVQAEKKYARQLDHLMKYTKTTRLVEDEKTRNLLLTRLKTLRQQNFEEKIEGKMNES
ncbi:hypothetical protein JOD43_000439 [Pullulanibacillus pueri]|uniref:Uncharacterized protein n=1 Tax=Pullulanibacillus pueri TaxID=1437324 RepID=A0A8J3EKU1_9BACL|nr:hypothetical protein [Pullulanibacillus pueri]MBM7680280.1 hypothetical protein [Pullulanibacillus pueri]GGH75863.1 hypothetical protein GCM10007096_05530 [Pullulanibacillus pueri]